MTKDFVNIIDEKSNILSNVIIKDLYPLIHIRLKTQNEHLRLYYASLNVTFYVFVRINIKRGYQSRIDL